MTQSGAAKKLIKIDISSDTVCPWCFVGKKNLDKAIALSRDQFDFEVRWHPFFLDASAPKEGVNKREFYIKKFGSRFEQIVSRMTEVFRGLGLEYNLNGLTGNTLDSHRLINLAGKQGLEKQHTLVEELFVGYFTQAKFIGDRNFLVEAAEKAGIEGAAQFLENPANGVNESIERSSYSGSMDLLPLTMVMIAIFCPFLEKYSAHITGAPYFVINGNQKLSGGQPAEAFLQAFERAAN